MNIGIFLQYQIRAQYIVSLQFLIKIAYNNGCNQYFLFSKLKTLYPIYFLPLTITICKTLTLTFLEKKIMKSYTTYLFDADGTLFDTAEMIYQCFKYTCKRFGDIDVSREAVFSNIGIPLLPQLECFLGEFSDEKAKRVMDGHMEFQMGIYEKYLVLFPETKNTLEKLKQDGKKIAIVTSRRLISLELYLKHTGILDYFDVLITPESTRKHKPEPEPAFAALEYLKSTPKESLFIGDSVFDIVCGNTAGMDTAFVKWSEIDSESLCVKPDWIVENMSEFLVVDK